MALHLRSSPLLLILPLGIYLSFSLINLDLPGLHYDETLFGNAALGNLDRSFTAWELTIAGRRFPVMLMPYIGALKAYLYYPIFKWCGTGVTAVRIPVILLGLGTLMFTYAFLRRTVGPWVALVSVGLLASDPTFIFMHKADWGPIALMSVLKSASIYFFFRWFNERGTVWLSLACFLMGVGVFDKLIFLWFVVAMMLTVIICFPQHFRDRLTARNLGIALCSFMVGCLPAGAFIVLSRGDSISNPNVFALSWLQNLTLRWNVFLATLNGTALINFFNNELPQNLAQLLRLPRHAHVQQILFNLREIVPPDGTAHFAGLILSFTIIGISLKRGRISARSTTLFYCVLPVVMAGLIFVTPGATGIQHFALLYPFSHIVIALALLQIRELNAVLPRRWFTDPQSTAVFLSFLLILLQLRVDLRYVVSLRSSGGVGIWSDAIYRLAEFVQNHPHDQFALMDWGFGNQLLVLTKGEIRKEESFIPLKDAKNERERFERMGSLLRRSGSFFVFHAKQYEIFPTLEIFYQAAESSRLKTRLRQVFYQRDGHPVYLLFEVSPE